MPSYNKVLFMGHLTRDPASKNLPSGTTVCEFGVACNRKYRTAAGEDREEVCFVDVSAFGRQAEVINHYCKKGKQLFIEGRLKYDTWDDKMGGGKRSKLSVVVENFQFLSGPRDDSDQTQDAPPQRQQYPRNRQTAATKAPAENPIPEDDGFKDESIPF